MGGWGVGVSGLGWGRAFRVWGTVLILYLWLEVPSTYWGYAH